MKEELTPLLDKILSDNINSLLTGGEEGHFNLQSVIDNPAVPGNERGPQKDEQQDEQHMFAHICRILSWILTQVFPFFIRKTIPLIIRLVDQPTPPECIVLNDLKDELQDKQELTKEACETIIEMNA